MTRRMKNILMALSMIVLIFAVFYTVNCAKESINGQGVMQNMYQNSKTPPEITENNENDLDNQRIPADEEQVPSQDFSDMERFHENPMDKRQNISVIYYGLFIVESLMLSFVILYLIMSQFNKKSVKETFMNTDKMIIYVLAVIILTAGLTVSESYAAKNIVNIDENNQTSTKTVTANDIDKGEIVNDSQIDLSHYSSNITISKAGEYTLTGELNNAVFVDADGAVTLHLDNVTIKNEMTAAIANISENELIIDLLDGSENVLQDGGSSEYDGCIFSMGNLTIEGSGTLKVYGCQEEGEGIATETKNITINGGDISIESNDDGLNAGGDGGLITINDGNIFIKAAGDGIDSNQNLEINGGTIYTMGSPVGGDSGIDTDDGFSINGGTVIALGSDMLEAPLNNSKQLSICFQLDSQISENTLVTLMNSEGEIIASFVAKENFKTLIISSNLLKEGEYSLYTGGSHSGELVKGIYTGGTYTQGEKVIINDSDSFALSKAVQLFGKGVR